MTEEINYSYDGGLYGEFMRNRAFLDDPKRAVRWSAVGEGASVEFLLAGPSVVGVLIVAKHAGVNTAFLMLAAIAAFGLGFFWRMVPETRGGAEKGRGQTAPSGAAA